MSQDLVWDFPSTGNGEEDGLNDSLRIYFEGDHERYIAREMIQNSIDARAGKEPVRVVFERLEVPAADLPELEQLKQIMEKAKNLASNQDNADAVYNKALACINQPVITVLKVSDFNTTGLNGSDTDRGDAGTWYRLVRSQGSSSQTGVGGGSYGIGKGAPFGASALRTVFYSTCGLDGGKAFQGKARLSSFEEDGDIKRGIGALGIKLDRGVASVRDEQDIPPLFRRDEQGTDIFIIGYQTENGDWRSKLAQSALNNFWAAIYFGDLVVELKDNDGTVTINKDNLEAHLREHHTEPGDAFTFYQAVVDERHAVFKESLKNLGEVQMYVLTGENFPKAVQMMRSPKMVVYTETRYRVLPEPYAAVFICDDEDKGNKLLRKLEPPKHDTWDKALDKENGNKVFRELNDWVKGNLRSLAEKPNTAPEEIPDLSKYLPEVTERDDLESGKAFTGEYLGTASEHETAKEIGAVYEDAREVSLPTKQKMVAVKGSARGTDTDRGGIADRRNQTHGDGASTTDEGRFPRIDTTDLRFRSAARKGTSGYEYTVLLTAPEDTQGAIKLIAIGDGSDYPAELEYARDSSGNPLQTNNAMITNLKLQKGQVQRIKVGLKGHRRYLLSLEAYGS